MLSGIYLGPIILSWPKWAGTSAAQPIEGLPETLGQWDNSVKS